MSCPCCPGGRHINGDREPFINPISLYKHCPLDNKKKSFTLPMIGLNIKDLSECQLQALPLECLQSCLKYLDIYTLTRMREVSQFVREAIDGLLPYREIYQHAPQALRALLSLGIASNIPLLRLHNALTTMECYYCKQEDTPRISFGTYLSLYEGRRCCMFCLRNSQALIPVKLIRLSALCSRRNCSLESIGGLEIVRSLLGSYGPLCTAVFVRTSLVRGPAIGVGSGNELTEIEAKALLGHTNSVRILHHPLALPSEESNIAPNRHYFPPYSSEQILHTYLSAIMFPYLTSDKQLDFGTMCKQCFMHMWWEEEMWTLVQTTRILHGMDPSASARRMDIVNNARQMASITYTTSREAELDGIRLLQAKRNELNASGPGDTEGVGLVLGELSIKAHLETHKNDNISDEEKEYREEMAKEQQGGFFNIAEHLHPVA